jgi:DNA polymerase I-like protein with 3'-5' exonuclease and polymerase domains
LSYACGDVDGGLEVSLNQEKELLQDPELTRFYVTILHPASRAFEQIEQGGIVVDLPKFKELKADLELEQHRLIKKAHGILGGRIVAKHYDSSRIGGLNLTKASLLKDFMFSPMGLNLKPKLFCEKDDKEGNKVPSTALEHLEMFADHPDAKDFVQLIAEYGSVTKTYTTYVVGFMEHIRSDGRMHPTYFLFAGNRDEGEGGAVTGRLSAVDPAFQCMVGETEVLTDHGYERLDKIVALYGGGRKVKTHTGEWKSVIGVYKNGVQEVFRITTDSGKQITCTENHPVLTDSGWVKTSDLSVGCGILTHRKIRAKSEQEEFQKEQVICIECLGYRETFDLTIKDSHSFIANGIVVHNTLPKHTTWAKRIRQCYTAPPGYVVLERDYGQGELRVIACLANCLPMIEVYKQNKDLHVKTAAGAAKMSYEEVKALEITNLPLYEEIRQKGKAGNFGLAITQDALVLTKTRGNVKIQEVLLSDLIWDGLEWVKHDGVISQGEYEVIEYGGVGATPDHQVWDNSGRKISLFEAAKEKVELARSATDNGVPIFWKFDNHKGAGNKNSYTICKNELQQMQPITCNKTQGPYTRYKQRSILSILETSNVQRSTFKTFGGSVRLHGTALLSRHSQAIKRLQGERNKSAIRLKRALYTLGLGEMARFKFQRDGVRQKGEQRALFTGKFAVGNFLRKPPQDELQRVYNVPREENVLDEVGKSLYSQTNSTIRRTRENGGRYYSTGNNISEDEKKELEGLGIKIKRVRVYDILNAGPRRRFTCNGRLVSNCFKMQVDGFITYAKKNYGVEFTKEQGTEFRDSFFKEYPQLLTYHSVYEAFAHRNKYVRSPLGRIRHLPLIDSPNRAVQAKEERRAVNSPVQGCLSDMLLWTLAIENSNGLAKISPAFGACHDAAYNYVPEDRVEQETNKMLEIQENLPFKSVGWNPQLNFPADAKYGPSMGNLTKFKKAGK